MSWDVLGRVHHFNVGCWRLRRLSVDYTGASSADTGREGPAAEGSAGRGSAAGASGGSATGGAGGSRYGAVRKEFSDGRRLWWKRLALDVGLGERREGSAVAGAAGRRDWWS